MIHGYPNRPSVLPGGSLTLHVSTDAPRFRVDVYRQGQYLLPVACLGWRPGAAFAPGRPDQDWGWPGYAFDIPADWPSGAYVAALVEDSREAGERVGADDRVSRRADADQPGPGSLPPPLAGADARSARVLFVVRSAAPGRSTPILYKLSWATYHAYNASGGGSVYVTPATIPHTAMSRVTTRRPGGGTGGDLSFPEAVDVYDPSTPREGFAHWDVPFIAWLDSQGLAVEYCTDLDLHRDPALLAPYSLLLSTGHDEYWSEPMRDSVERFVREGGNVAFFSGNTCWWRIHFQDDDTAFACAHPPTTRPDGDEWWRVRPENGLTGVSYRNAGGWWSGEREAVGYTVQHADHWIFARTGLRDGDELGRPQRLVGYECDGALFERPHPGLAVPTGTDGTPPDFAILGMAPLGPGWQDRPLGNNAAATMGLYSDRGTVFTCATTDWARVLHAGEPSVEQITRNVLARLSARGVRIAGPFPAPYSTTVAAEHATVQFQVDPSELPADQELRYHWAVSRGEAGPGDGPTFRATLPAGPSLVTVIVTVTSGGSDRPVAFGTRTIRLLTRREAAQLELQAHLRDLLGAATPAVKAPLESGPGNRTLCDPLWDPVRDGLRTPLSPDSVRAALSASDRLAATARSLAALQRDEPV